MKAVFLSFDQAHKEDVMRILDKQLIRGYTMWDEVQGRGSETGEPHLGTHAWPTLNGSILAIVEDGKVVRLKELVKSLDEASPMLGIRMFVWNIEDSY